MSLLLKITGLCVGFAMAALVCVTMKNKKMNEVQGILWIIAAFVIIILCLFPSIVGWAANIFGIIWPPAVVVFIMVVLLAFIIFNHSKEITILKAQIAELSEQLAITKHELQKEKERNSSKL